MISIEFSVRLWHPSLVMTHYDIHNWYCDIVMFKNHYVALKHISRIILVMSHCDINERFCLNTNLIKGMLDDNVHHWIGLIVSHCSSHLCFHILKWYVSQCLSYIYMRMKVFDKVDQTPHKIVTVVNADVTLQCSIIN